MARLARRDEHEQILHPVVNPKSAQGGETGPSPAICARSVNRQYLAKGSGASAAGASGDFAWSVIDRAIKG